MFGDFDVTCLHLRNGMQRQYPESPSPSPQQSGTSGSPPPQAPEQSWTGDAGSKLAMAQEEAALQHPAASSATPPSKRKVVLSQEVGADERTPDACSHACCQRLFVFFFSPFFSAVGVSSDRPPSASSER